MAILSNGVAIFLNASVYRNTEQYLTFDFGTFRQMHDLPKNVFTCEISCLWYRSVLNARGKFIETVLHISHWLFVDGIILNLEYLIKRRSKID